MLARSARGAAHYPRSSPTFMRLDLRARHHSRHPWRYGCRDIISHPIVVVLRRAAAAFVRVRPQNAVPAGQS
jgi:hypothetical protein